MDDVKKMLRAVINGQSSLKQELLGEIHKVDKKVENLTEETREGFRKTHSRINKLGRSLSYLEDDALIREEHDKLEGRVAHLEQRIVSA